ncbi:hypothetical protein NAEGRDRAFT_79747 [Naegleria gruberi]|uniref:Uncharacterized protein n=1 Tax=Naegleria gruberi TaxID=5762 RepID=D2VFE0_NAEGR|nr:uncharacterized protein NAEGRDRAFT_79747 [Naegleria gruberi]EFC44444.1 hypothetical protein NAEGRDRAFT_79747 [Naegleria gruberi]|eukprot:XP_002677188.1 hypothetical protein NAEGRDRAFT_79747 [Naegleria gruberi strain NEG-M]
MSMRHRSNLIKMASVPENQESTVNADFATSDRKTNDETASQTSYTASVLSGKYSKISQSKKNKVFNLEKTKMEAWTFVLSKKKAFEHHSKFCEMFLEFLSSEMSDRLLSLCIIYISNILKYERYRVKYELKLTEEHYEPMVEAKRECINNLTELSYAYSQILQEYTFRSPHNLRFRDTVKETMFFEALYMVAAYVTTADFSNQKLQSIIENEIGRLFRTKHFRATDQEKPKFLTAEESFKLKHYGFKLPSDTLKRRKITTAVNARSPLVSSVFPAFNRVAQDMDFAFEQINLDIPPHILFSIKDISGKMGGESSKEEEASLSSKQSILNASGMV